jgi:hypothetical protein
VEVGTPPLLAKTGGAQVTVVGPQEIFTMEIPYREFIDNLNKI